MYILNQSSETDPLYTMGVSDTVVSVFHNIGWVRGSQLHMVCSFSEYFLRTYYVPSNELGSRNVVMTAIKFPFLHWDLLLKSWIFHIESFNSVLLG